MLPARTLPAPNPIATPVAVAASAAVAPEEANALQVIRGLIAPLLELAARNAPIEEGVDYLAENLTDEMDEAIENPQWWAIFAQFVPEAIPHRGWITTVREAYLALPLEDEAGTDAPLIPAQETAANDTPQNSGAASA